MFSSRWLLAAVVVVGIGPEASRADESPAAAAKPKLTTQELADWIDRRFGEEYQIAGLNVGEPVDDATFLRRAFLDLQGRVPTVSQIRDFLAESGSFKRQDMVDRLLIETKQPDRFAQRSADHLARVWRRMMVPASSPGAGMAGQLDPWLAKQFANNTPYDQIARKLLLVQPPQPMGPLGATPSTPAPADPDAAAAAFQQAVGLAPENLAGAYVRVFLGIRINCAQCHDHPRTDWKRGDFWGIAALFGGAPTPGDQPIPAPTIKPEPDKDIQFTAKLLWEPDPLKEIPAKKSPREVLADWLVSPDNKNFAATAVNRVWQYLCGRGLSGPVDELDLIDDPSERKVLDELATLFKESGHDIRWLIAGITKSKVYQQRVVPAAPREFPGFVHRPLKTLMPEQVFDSLEQALALPIAKADNGPRFNGERNQFVARMNESATDQPADFKGGIPQALMLMNGRLTADATNLETSRTLRAVVEAPFLPPAEKIEVLYLAALTRKPTTEEADFLLRHVSQQKTDAERKAAYAEIFWGLLNNPEFVLSR
jgi:Protein of unknown function (DUF1549)/Protein of unknown function (DUF1553)